MSASAPQIRLILLDAFGTLFTPRTAVHHQYTQGAREYGLKVQEDAVKQGFKQAYKEMAKSSPLYGKLSKPKLTPSSWWKGVIEKTFLHAGVEQAALAAQLPELSRTLIERFWSKKGYRLHSDVKPFLQLISQLPSPPLIGIVSGSDPGVLKVLRDLQILIDPPYNEINETSPAGIRVENVYTTWDLEMDKSDPALWSEIVLRRKYGRLGKLGLDGLEEAEVTADQILVVGDEVITDYLTPRKAGMRTLLLRRRASDSPLTEFARFSHQENEPEEDFDTISNLTEILDWLKTNSRN